MLHELATHSNAIVNYQSHVNRIVQVKHEIQKKIDELKLMIPKDEVLSISWGDYGLL